MLSRVHQLSCAHLLEAGLFLFAVLEQLLPHRGLAGSPQERPVCAGQLPWPLAQRLHLGVISVALTLRVGAAFLMAFCSSHYPVRGWGEASPDTQGSGGCVAETMHSEALQRPCCAIIRCFVTRKGKCKKKKIENQSTIKK
jgi:hypothetical protein